MFQHHVAFAVLLYLEMVEKTLGSDASVTTRHLKVSSTFLEEQHHHPFEQKGARPRLELEGVQQPHYSPAPSQLDFEFPVRKAFAGFWGCFWSCFFSYQIWPMMLLPIHAGQETGKGKIRALLP